MSTSAIEFAFEQTPEAGSTQEIAPGVHWLRMPLPFSLDHINLWLFRDHGAWVVVDTGLGTDVSRKVWDRTFSDAMGGDPVSQVVVTHLHPDHSGCAGWLADRFDVDLWMTREEYLLCRILVGDTGKPAPEAGVRFYRAAGWSENALNAYRKVFGMFGRYISPLPEAYRRLRDGQVGPVGLHQWEVVVGRGHSPEHACFYCEELKLLVSGDQVLPSISANVSVYPTEPEANPLEDWFTTLCEMKERVADDVLVLPALGQPFRGLHARIDAILNGHEQRLEALLEHCDEPCRVVDTFDALYRTPINDDNLMFATGEAIAHLHYLLERNQILLETDADGVNWYRRT